MLGARVNKHTVIAHKEDYWTVVKDGEAEEQYTEDELLKSIQKHGDKVKWTSVEAKRDARPMERAIGGRWARIKTAATAAARAARAAMRLSPRNTDTTGRATARSRTWSYRQPVRRYRSGRSTTKTATTRRNKEGR
jgi:hypothetical protein